MAIKTGEKYREMMSKYAVGLRNWAKIKSKKNSIAIRAMAGILEKIADMDVEIGGMDRYFYFAIKDANKELEKVYYTPDEALGVVKEAVFANPLLKVQNKRNAKVSVKKPQKKMDVKSRKQASK